MKKAKTKEAMREHAQRRLGKTGPRAKYPWTKWMSKPIGKPFKLTRGKEFTGEPHGMAQMIRNYALRYGYVVTVSTHSDSIIATIESAPKKSKRKGVK